MGNRYKKRKKKNHKSRIEQSGGKHDNISLDFDKTKKDKDIKNKRHKTSKNKKNSIKIIILVVLVIICLYSGINILRWAIYNASSKKAINKITKEVIVGDLDSVQNNKDEENDIKCPIDFKALKEINSDATSWIRIEGTSINYPVLKTTDNDYYLHKDIYKKYSSCGWIFMDCKNLDNYIDMNTVIFGHNIKTGLMFADLTKVLDGELGKDITINIYTPNERLDYKVFSSYKEEPEDYAIKSNITDIAVMRKYVMTMLERSSTVYNVVPTETDKVLTLSTCDNTGKQRIIIHAVLTNIQDYKK